MRNQLPPGARACRVLPGAEDDVITNRKGQRVHRASRLRRWSIGVDAHVGKVMAETRREKIACRTIQRFSR